MNYCDCPGFFSAETARRLTTATLRLVLAALSVAVTSCGEAPDLHESRPAAISSSVEKSSRGGTALEIASYAVESDGSTIYLGSGRDLVVLRRDGTGIPQPVSRVALPGVIRDLDLEGNLLAAACGEGGMVLVEVSRPESPRVLAAERLADRAEGVALQDGRAMVAARSAGISIFDLSGPGPIRLLGRYETEEPALRIAAEGSILYVAASFGGMRVLDASDPANLREIGFANRGAYDMGTAVDVAVSGGRAYVANREIGLRVLDIARPEEPTTRSVFPLLHAPSALAVMGSLVLVADQDNGLQVVDAGDPLRPQAFGSLALPGRATDLVVVGRVACIAAGEGGVWTVDLADPRRPALSGAYLIGENAVALTGSRQGFVVVDTLRGARVFSTSGLAPPEEVSTVPSVDAPAVVVGGRYLTAARKEALALLDLADPQSPVATASIPLQSQPGSLAALGDRALLVGSDSGLQLFDLADPSQPHRIGELPIEKVCYPPAGREGGFKSPVFTSTIWGLSVYREGVVTACDQGIAVTDLSDPALPRVRGFLALPQRVLHVEAADGTAYLSCDDGLRIIDLSGTGPPAEVGRYRSPGFLQKTVLRDNLLFAIDLQAGLLVFDVSNPAQPREIARCGLPGRPVDLLSEGSLIRIAAGEAGVLAVDVSDPLHPRLLQSPGS